MPAPQPFEAQQLEPRTLLSAEVFASQPPLPDFEALAIMDVMTPMDSVEDAIHLPFGEAYSFEAALDPRGSWRGDVDLYRFDANGLPFGGLPQAVQFTVAPANPAEDFLVAAFVDTGGNSSNVLTSNAGLPKGFITFEDDATSQFNSTATIEISPGDIDDDFGGVIWIAVMADSGGDALGGYRVTVSAAVGPTVNVGATAEVAAGLTFERFGTKETSRIITPEHDGTLFISTDVRTSELDPDALALLGEFDLFDDICWSCVTTASSNLSPALFNRWMEESVFSPANLVGGGPLRDARYPPFDSVTLVDRDGNAIVAEIMQVYGDGGVYASGHLAAFHVEAGQQYLLHLDAEDTYTQQTLDIAISVEPSLPGAPPSPSGDSGDGVVAVGDPVSGTADASGLLTLTTRAYELGPVAFQETTDGGWSFRQINPGDSIADSWTFQVETFTDPKTGRVYAAAGSNDGLLLFRREADGTWSERNLGSGSVFSGMLGSVTAFVDTQGMAHVAGRNIGNDLVIFSQSPDRVGDDYTWTTRNVSQTDLAPRDQSLPSTFSSITSYVTSWNQATVVGLDTETGDILAVWRAPGAASWNLQNLSDATGAPRLVGGVTAFLTSWNAINLVGTDEAGRLSATWWVPGNQWATADLTAAAGGPELDATGLSAWVAPWGAMNIAGLSDSGELMAYWWTPQTGRWQVANITSASGTDLELSGEVRGLTVENPNRPSLNVLGTTEDGDVVRIWWSPTTTGWNATNISLDA